MKIAAFTLALALGTLGIAIADNHGHADDEHEILEKVMKDGMKGDESHFGKIKEGAGSAEDYTELYELVRLMRGTKAPVGEQAAYDEKVAALIKAAGVTAYTEPTDASVAALKEAANCKACHNEHKPD